MDFVIFEKFIKLINKEYEFAIMVVVCILVLFGIYIYWLCKQKETTWHSNRQISMNEDIIAKEINDDEADYCQIKTINETL